MVASGELPWGERPDPDDLPAEPTPPAELGGPSDGEEGGEEDDDEVPASAVDPDVVADLEAQAAELVEHAEELEERLARKGGTDGTAEEHSPPPDEQTPPPEEQAPLPEERPRP